MGNAQILGDLGFGQGDLSPAGSRGSVTFHFPADGVSWVRLSGEMTGWSKEGIPMIRDGDHFRVTVPLAPGRTWKYKFITSADTVWSHDPYNLENSPDGYGGFNSAIRLDEEGNVLPPMVRDPFNRTFRTEHFTIATVEGRTTEAEALAVGNQLETFRSGLVKVLEEICALGVCEPTGHLSPECLEAYNDLKYPVREEKTLVLLLPRGAGSRQQVVGDLGWALIFGTGYKMDFYHYATLTSHLSGRYAHQLGKYGLSMALTAKVMNQDLRAGMENAENNQVTVSKTYLEKGKFLQLANLAEDPLATYYSDNGDQFAAWSESSALFTFLLGNFPANAVYRFAKCGDFSCLEMKDWAELQGEFTAWLSK